MSNGAVRGSPIPQVHDYSIVVAFGGPLFDILTKVPSSNSNAFVAFGDQHKMANQVLGVGVVFVD